MIIEVQHETRLQYSRPVTEWLAEMRVEPLSDLDQSCQKFHLAVSQTVPISHYSDGFGNRVHHFNLMNPHQEVRVLAAGVVETHPRARPVRDSVATYPLVADILPVETLDFVNLRGPVNPSERLTALTERLRPTAGARLGELALTVAEWIGEHYEYAPYVTQASSPVDEVLELGRGVCQDFAHLMTGVLRLIGVPTRYVSGYIHRPGQESQSHAWCEVWLPDLGWVGIDPTNRKQVDENFIKVAIGRDFTDVPPNKGVYRGLGIEMVSARVETRELERLPTLSWQEQLPPLDVPLRSVLTPARPRQNDFVIVEQQQQ